MLFRSCSWIFKKILQKSFKHCRKTLKSSNKKRWRRNRKAKESKPFPIIKVVIAGLAVIVLVGASVTIWKRSKDPFLADTQVAEPQKTVPTPDVANQPAPSIGNAPPAVAEQKLTSNVPVEGDAPFHVPAAYADWKKVVVVPGLCEALMPPLNLEVKDMQPGVKRYLVKDGDFKTVIAHYDFKLSGMTRDLFSQVMSTAPSNTSLTGSTDLSFAGIFPCYYRSFEGSVNGAPGYVRQAVLRRGIVVGEHGFDVTVLRLPSKGFDLETRFFRLIAKPWG